MDLGSSSSPLHSSPETFCVALADNAEDSVPDKVAEGSVPGNGAEDSVPDNVAEDSVPGNVAEGLWSDCFSAFMSEFRDVSMFIAEVSGEVLVATAEAVAEADETCEGSLIRARDRVVNEAERELFLRRREWELFGVDDFRGGG